MSFFGASAAVFRLHEEGRFGDALAVVAGLRDRFPLEDATLTFWEACLMSMDGSPDASLSALQKGLGCGLWWSEAMLADPDLDAVRHLGAWEEFLRESDGRATGAAATRPGPTVRASTVPNPRGMVVTLHGAQANIAAHADQWLAAVPGDWGVISPVGTVPATIGRWSWPVAAAEAVAAVLGQLPGLDWEEPVLICGYSQGGRVAINLAAGAPAPPRGLILFAPAVRVPGLPSAPEVPTFIHIGDRDWSLAGVDALARIMSERGTPVQVERISGLGHAVPEDPAPVLDRALTWFASLRGD